MVEKDFSKCQCPQAGWCELLEKEMTASPPNWQWCQGLTEEARKEYHGKVHKKPRSITSKQFYSDVIHFVDPLPPRCSNYAVCVIPATEDMMRLMEITRPSIKAYADKCGADYIELQGNQNEQWPMGNKYRVYNVSKEYESTLYLDCDIVIRDHAPNIFDETPRDKISLYEEWYIWQRRGETDWIEKEQEAILRKFVHEKSREKWLKNGRFVASKMFNGGVMVIPKAVAHLYKQPSFPYPKQWCFDQNYLTFTMPPELHHPLDEKWNLTWQAMRDWDTMTSPTHEWMKRAKDAYFLHVNGEKNETLRHHILNIDLDDETSYVLSNHEMVSKTVPHHSTFLICPQALETQTKLNLELREFCKSQKKNEEIDINRDLHIALVGHSNKQWKTIEQRPYLHKFDLNKVKGKYSDNTWAESRAYADKDIFPDHAKFVGFISASWNIKYSKQKPIHDLHQWPEVDLLLNSKPEDKVYMCADMYCSCVWLRKLGEDRDPKRLGVISDVFGVEKYPVPQRALKALLKIIGLTHKTNHRPVPFSNQGIFHRSIYDDWMKFLEDQDVFEKTNWIAHKFNLTENPAYSQRPYAYFMEAVHCFWCQHQDYRYIGMTSRNLDWYGHESRTKRGW